MKSIFFDTGPIISIAMNNMMDLFEKLRLKYSGNFYITPSVKDEAVDNPMKTKKFKFEAFQNLKLINEGVLKVYVDKELEKTTHRLLDLANNIFYAHDTALKIVHFSEIETLAGAVISDAEAVVIDEFTTRLLVENPARVKERLMSKLHTNITINGDTLSRFNGEVKNLRVLRSIELITVAYELGFLDMYKDEKFSKENLLDAVLWGLKLNGCSVSSEEIETLKKIEK